MCLLAPFVRLTSNHSTLNRRCGGRKSGKVLDFTAKWSSLRGRIFKVRQAPAGADGSPRTSGAPLRNSGSVVQTRRDRGQSGHHFAHQPFRSSHDGKRCLYAGRASDVELAMLCGPRSQALRKRYGRCSIYLHYNGLKRRRSTW